MWVYRKIKAKGKKHRYVVGYYNPKGRWCKDSKWKTKAGAIARIHYLNGGDFNDFNGEYKSTHTMFEKDTAGNLLRMKICFLDNGEVVVVSSRDATEREAKIYEAVENHYEWMDSDDEIEGGTYTFT